MPITIKHGAVGTLGRLAVQAGQARGQQLQAGRDIQITNMALAAQDRTTQMGLAARDRASERAFRFQAAGARQYAERQPAEPSAQALRGQLKRTVTDAKESGIYTPVQIRQMGIFADLGDEAGLKNLLGRVIKPATKEKPTAEARKLSRQSEALHVLTGEALDSQQRELDKINAQIFEFIEDPDSQRDLEENPDRIPEAKRIPLEALFARRQRVFRQTAEIKRRVGEQQRGLFLGFSLPVQKDLTDKQLIRERKAVIERVKRIEKRNQDTLNRKIIVEQRKLKRDQHADQEIENNRINAAKEELIKLNDELKASFDREDAVLSGVPLEQILTLDEQRALADQLLGKASGDFQKAQRLEATGR